MQKTSSNQGKSGHVEVVKVHRNSSHNKIQPNHSFTVVVSVLPYAMSQCS